MVCRTRIMTFAPRREKRVKSLVVSGLAVSLHFEPQLIHLVFFCRCAALKAVVIAHPERKGLYFRNRAHPTPDPASVLYRAGPAICGARPDTHGPHTSYYLAPCRGRSSSMRCASTGASLWGRVGLTQAARTSPLSQPPRLRAPPSSCRSRGPADAHRGPAMCQGRFVCPDERAVAGAGQLPALPSLQPNPRLVVSRCVGLHPRLQPPVLQAVR